MAGVYIKGMKMPEKGLLEIIMAPDGICYELERPLIDTENAEITKFYNAVAVPDHGDLVDRGALEDTVRRLNFPEEYPPDDVEESWGITRNQYKLIDNVLFQMPTVIPADKEEV